MIDSGCAGEVFIDIHNIGKDGQMINAGDKIAQVVLIPVVHFRPYEADEEDLYDEYSITISDRGAGALGSTDEPYEGYDDEYDDDDDDDEYDDDDDWDDEE